VKSIKRKIKKSEKIEKSFALLILLGLNLTVKTLSGKS